MPDGLPQKDFVYRAAHRDKTAPLIMISGPPGTGKTYSALLLARGMAGPNGTIFLADTDNGRAKFYADEFQFQHLNLHEPFRPIIFEEAARQAQKQGAAVLIIDNFMAEHAGPGGLLEWHEEINVRLARGDAQRLESTKMLAWAEPKAQHKRMRERLYQLNMPVILCCGAERKIAMVKQTEGKDRGKTIPVDQGFKPICGADIPWAMTVSLMLLDVAHPGVPTPIKALLPALKPIIRLDAPLDEETGRRIAAWSRGEPTEENRVDPNPAQPATAAGSGQQQAATGGTSGQETANAGSEPPPETANNPPEPPADRFPGDEPPPDVPPAGQEPPPPAPDAPDSPGGDRGPDTGVYDQPRSSGRRARDVPEAEIEAGAHKLADLFNGVRERSQHLKIVDNEDNRKQIEWLRRNRRKLFDELVNAALKDSWKRTEAPKPDKAEQI